MHLEVSNGEALDKLSILDIKSSRIRDDKKRVAVNREKEALSQVRALADAHPLLYRLLIDTNERIWDLTDTVKSMHDTDPLYASTARQIFDENQTRFRIKAMVNTATSSSLQEQKGYAETAATLVPTNPKRTLSALWSLALSYDEVFLSKDVDLLPASVLPPLVRIGEKGEQLLDTDVDIGRIERSLSQPIRYAAGGKLGDFIHQLSVVYERYLQTGRRGCLYLSDTLPGSDCFARGAETTCVDIAPILMKLPYIDRVEVYTGQRYDVNLSSWRSTPELYSKSWQQIYGEAYAVSWGAHAWMTAPKRDDLVNVVLVNTSPTRWTDEVNWNTLFAKLGGTPMFLNTNPSDYQHFCQRTGLRLPCVDGSSFTDIVTAIQSCRIFVGTLSMPLAVADALKHERIAITKRGSPDESVAIRTDSRYVHQI